MMFDIPQQGEPLAEEKPLKEPKLRTPRVKAKNDPRLVAAARELRDQWLERVNRDPLALSSHGKYDLGRQLEGPSTTTVAVKKMPLLIEETRRAVD
ncbi:MAG: hypothetical protein IAG10_31155 [Planctomycetaceae bacterium]|nr:hypothetical protein [Planctomycetaceae bacterium]